MMKKSIFAVAVASALTLSAAQAETVLYGSIRYDYENIKAGTTDRDNISNLSDAGSRIGIRGSEDLGNGFGVIYNLEWGFDGMENKASENESDGFHTRIAYLGLTSQWGTLTAGRQDNPFYQTIVDDTVVDDFNGSSVITAATARAMTTTLSADRPTSGKKYDEDFDRVGKVIAYTSPEFAGFSANAAIMMDEDLYGVNSRKNADLWTINAKYAHDLGEYGEFLGKVGYIQGKVSGRSHMKKSSKVWGLYLGYIKDALTISAAYADGNQSNIGGQTGDKAKSKGWDLGASYSFGPNYFSTIRATYGQSELKLTNEKDKVKSWAVGFEQKLSTRTRAWVEYGKEDTKYTREKGDHPKHKVDVISIGMRHDF